MKKSDNILIAEFLGFEKVETWYEDKEMLLPDHIYVYGNSFDEDELMFNISWDWLMPAIQKLFNTNFTAYQNLEELMEEYFSSDFNMLGLDFDTLFNRVIELLKKLK